MLQVFTFNIYIGQIFLAKTTYICIECMHIISSCCSWESKRYVDITMFNLQEKYVTTTSPL